MNNPYLQECPDYTTDTYAAEWDELITTGLTVELATSLLQKLWKKSNDTAKLCWDEKVDADHAATDVTLLAEQ